MLLKKPTIAALCTNCNVLAQDAPLVTWTTSWRRPHHPRRQAVPGADLPAISARKYSAVYQPQENPRKSVFADPAPPRWPSSPNPTPYDIFGLARTAPYSKLRFYELVKLYHPDRLQHNSRDGVPDDTKIDRYRLVVAANDILSDPEKRRLYDLRGIGWMDHLEGPSSHRDVDREWRKQPGNASMNATWEDWEKWYQARDGKKPDPVYMSNGGFAFIIAVFIVIAAWGQATRAGNNSKTLVEMREEMHQGVSSGLRRRRVDSSNLDREARVDSFLKQRDGWNYDQPCGAVHDPDRQSLGHSSK